MEYVPIEQVRHQLLCPFCNGNEDETPAAIAAFDPRGKPLSPHADPSTWLVRVIPNKFPSLLSSRQMVDAGPYQHIPTNGVQEILIPSPRHITSLSELSDDELRVALVASQTRVSKIRRMDGILHVMLFMNCRLEAGASLGHVHLQLMGSPVLSSALLERSRRDQKHRIEHAKPIIQTIVDWEVQEKSRVVKMTDNFVVVCPFASRFAFQIWIVPRDMDSTYETSSPEVQFELGLLTRECIARIELLLDKPAYNVLLHDSPQRSAEANPDGFRPWYFEIFPRLTRAAGYELGTDIWVNPVAPESAAKRLRN